MHHIQYRDKDMFYPHSSRHCLKLAQHQKTKPVAVTVFMFHEV